MTRIRVDSPGAQAPQPPHPLKMLLEARAPLELAATLAGAAWWRRLPRGDRHPVIVYPGLTANDFTTLLLRRFLERLGYAVHPWRQGMNFGPRVGVLERCRTQLLELAQRHGRSVSLIGWSLGGLYARELAKELPEHTRCAITLGTPFTGHPRATRAWRLFEFVSGRDTSDPAILATLRDAPPVPTTSIYSRSDGVVAWHCSVNEPGPLVENIEVRASHLGMGVNPMALYAIADRLAQPMGAWKHFEPGGARRWFFRTHAGVPASQVP